MMRVQARVPGRAKRRVGSVAVRRVRGLAISVIAVGLPWLAVGSSRAESPDRPDVPAVNSCREAVARALTADPYGLPLAPTATSSRAFGSARLTFAPSPFGATVTQAGHHVYDLRVMTQGLPRRAGVENVVWVATPNLDQVQNVGALDDEGIAVGRVSFNKMLVFVTAERSADVERWSGPIVMRGISPSGLMHTMAGHGPFEGMPC